LLSDITQIFSINSLKKQVLEFLKGVSFLKSGSNHLLYSSLVERYVLLMNDFNIKKHKSQYFSVKKIGNNSKGVNLSKNLFGNQILKLVVLLNFK
jgi:hypothetical protein